MQPYECACTAFAENFAGGIGFSMMDRLDQEYRQLATAMFGAFSMSWCLGVQTQTSSDNDVLNCTAVCNENRLTKLQVRLSE